MPITPGTLGGKPEVVVVNPDQLPQQLPAAASQSFKPGDILRIVNGQLTQAIDGSGLSASQGVQSTGNLGELYFCLENVATGGTVNKDDDRVNVYRIKEGQIHVRMQFANLPASAGSISAATNTTRGDAVQSGSYRLGRWTNAASELAYALTIETDGPDLKIVNLPPDGLLTSTYATVEVTK
jgi:hypothetical protein